jgi:hypothetical protein
MLRADTAKIEWSSEKKRWHVIIQVGAEVIKRWVETAKDTEEQALKTLAVETAKDEGYEVDGAHVSVVR